MNYGTNEIKAEVEYRRYGTVDRGARKHLDQLRGRSTWWGRVRARGGRRPD